MKKFFQYFRKLKMNYQVTVFGAFITAIVLLVILGTCLAQTQILFNIIQTSSEMITIKQERRSIQQASIRIKDYLKRKYDQSVYNVIHIEQFFEAVLDIQEREYQISNQLFPPCAISTTKRHQKSKIKYDTNLFCYQSLTNPDGITLPQNNTQIDQLNAAVSLLSQYSLLFDVQNETQLFIFDLPKTQMMISYPQNYQPRNFNISYISWIQYYLNQLSNPNQTIYYSPVYLSAITNELNMAVIATLPDQSGIPIGFTAQSILLNDENMEAIRTNILLVNDQGEIIFSSVDTFGEAIEQIYIYNTTYTGFNETDWNLIQDYSRNENLSSYSCKGFQNTFCLYNKHFNRTVQVNAVNFEGENFTLVVFVNITYQSELANQFSQSTGKLYMSIVQIYWILITVSFLILLLMSLCIQIIFLPLFQLMVHIKLHIKTLGNNLTREIFTMTKRLNMKSNIFSKLTIRFITLQNRLSKSQITKNSLCLQIEKFSYNKNPTKIDIQKIKEKVFSLRDMDSLQLSKSSREIFKSSLIQLYQQNQQN